MASTPKPGGYYLSQSPVNFAVDPTPKKDWNIKSIPKLKKPNYSNLLSPKSNIKDNSSSKNLLKVHNLSEKQFKSIHTSKTTSLPTDKQTDYFDMPMNAGQITTSNRGSAHDLPEYSTMQSECNSPDLPSNTAFERHTRDQRGLIERSQRLATKRKTEILEGASPLRKPLRNLSQTNLKKSQDFQPGKTLTKFIDRMILKGSLPLEATDYFVPHPKQQSLSQIKLKPITKKQDDKHSSSLLNNSESLAFKNSSLSVIPEWMVGLSDFQEKYRQTQLAPKFPILEILKKEPDARDELEVNLLMKYLVKMDIFSKFPFDVLIELSKRLKIQHFKEGQIICNVGDPADCMFIIYDGEIDVLLPEKGGDRLAVKSFSGELLGRQNLDKPGKRAAKLKATKPTFVIALYREDFQEVSNEITNNIKPTQEIQEFIMNHQFLKQFSEAKRNALINGVEFKRYYKNDLLYNIGERSDRFYILMKGIVTRQMMITREKVNKWPVDLNHWEMFKKTTTYSVKLPIVEGQMFGVRTFIEDKPRTEKVIVEADALILRCPKKLFYEIFENYEVSIFMKRAEEIENIKTEKLKEMFETNEKLNKIKKEQAQSNHLAAIKYTANSSQTTKIKQWIRAEEKLSSPTFTEKKVVEKNVVRKGLSSVYDS